MSQHQKELLVENAVAIIDMVINNGDYYWNKTPEWVKEQIVTAADGNETITYNKCANILIKAETCKLIGSANRYMVAIRENWRKVSK